MGKVRSSDGWSGLVGGYKLENNLFFLAVLPWSKHWKSQTDARSARYTVSLADMPSDIKNISRDDRDTLNLHSGPSSCPERK